MQNFEVSGTVKPGTKFINLVFPAKLLNDFNDSYVLLIQLFGNELLKQNIYVSRQRGQKTAFEPEPAWKIQGAYQRLVEPFKCKIFILDIPLRHARCCTLQKKTPKGPA